MASQAPPRAGRWLALLNPGLLGQGLFGHGCVASMLYGALLYGSTYLLPLWMASCLGFGVAESGTALMVAGLAMMVGMLLAGRLLDRRPGVALVSLGFGLMALSLVLLSWFSRLGWRWTAVSAGLGRLGLGLALAALYVTALRSLPTALAAQGASLSNFMQTVGGALGAAISGAVLDRLLALHRPPPGMWLCLINGSCNVTGDALWLLALLAVVACAVAWPLRGRATRS